MHPDAVDPSSARPSQTSGRLRVSDDIELAYDRFGHTGRPLVLIMGLAAQRLFWDDGLCERFAAAGFDVVRFDHHDIGESTRLPRERGVPRPGRVIARRAVGARIDVPYTLSDMANDVAGLIDGLGFGSAHVVGVSLGGMIAQHLALEHPDRVRSLTSIMSSAGAPGPRSFLPERRAVRTIFKKAPRNAQEAGEHIAKLFEALGGAAWPSDPDRLRAIGELAYARGNSPRGFLRQFAAIMASGDRRPRLKTLQVPTLVIHGSRDPLVPVGAGRATAQAIPDATWLPIAGMGHHMPPSVWPTLVAAITRHAERVDARSAT